NEVQFTAALPTTCFVHPHGDHRDLHSFPTRRSSDLVPRMAAATRIAMTRSPGVRRPAVARVPLRDALWMLALGLSSVSAQPLRIATFNVKWLTASAAETRMAPWKDDAQLVRHRRDLARVIAALRADALCLQEVTSRRALEMLAAEPALEAMKYRVLHIESDGRGTGQDVAFLVSPRIRLDTLEGHLVRRFADTLSGRPSDMKRNDPRRQRLTKHALICF